MRPPGNTQRSGMKLWPPWRLPISTRGFLASRRMIITVAAFFGRTARWPGMRGGPSGLWGAPSGGTVTVAFAVLGMKQLYDRARRRGKPDLGEGGSGLSARAALLAGAD